MEALKVLEHENCCLRMMTMNINIMKCFCEKEKVRSIFFFLPHIQLQEVERLVSRTNTFSWNNFACITKCDWCSIQCY